MDTYWSDYLTISTMIKVTKKHMVIIDKIFSKRPNTNDGNKTNIGKTDQRMFIFCNGPPSGHNSLHKLLKTVLVSMYGAFYS